jgi:hypothetical protein
MDTINYDYKQHIERLKLIRQKMQAANVMSEKSCDICGTSDGDIKLFMTFNMCPSCIKNEQKLQDEIKAGADERVKALTLNHARKIDDNIRYNGDVYNAAVVSIVDLEKIIGDDSSIAGEHKYFMLAKEVSDRINKFSGKIFEVKTELNTLETQQVVHQRKLNELAEKLSKEEREKLKLIAINYKPQLTNTKPNVKVPKIGPKSENLSLVLKDYPKMNIDDAKLAALYLDKMNRTQQVMTTADAVSFVNSTK